jgi:hypothetical protein
MKLGEVPRTPRPRGLGSMIAEKTIACKLIKNVQMQGIPKFRGVSPALLRDAMGALLNRRRRLAVRESNRTRNEGNAADECFSSAC